MAYISSIFTGTSNIDAVLAGLNYAPENGISTTYYDDVMVSDAFIGSGGGGANSAPTAPSILYAEGQTNPASISDSTPEFSAIYNDPNAGDLANKYVIQVDNNSDFSSVYWNSGTATMATTTAGNRSPDIIYAGSALASSTTYYWRILFLDDEAAVGAWSTTTATFSLAAGGGGNSAPTAPTSLLAEGQTNPTNISDSTPEFSALYNDPNGADTATYYQIQVDNNSDFASTYWDSTKTSLASSTPVGMRIADISYSGSTLASSTAYYWRIKFWDNSDAAGAWSTSTSTFSLAASQGGGTTTPSTIIQDITYAYDAVGNITTITDYSGNGLGKIIAYGYDDLYRLTRASTTAASSTPFLQTYTYNALGNITNKSDVGSYTYAGTSYANPHAPTSVNGVTQTYDTNGNLTNNGTYTYTWDYRNRLTQSSASTTSTYGYDEAGQRVKLVEGSTTTIYPNKLFNTTGTNGTSTRSIYANNVLVATLSSKVSSAGGSGSSTTTTHTLYGDSLRSGFSNWSWGATVTLNHTGTVYAGTNSTRVVYNSSWGGLYFRSATGVSTATSTHLQFAVRSGAASPYLELESYGPGDTLLANVSLNDYIPGGSMSANTWYLVSIPLEDLDLDNTSMTGFVAMKDATGTMYFDDVKLIALSGGGGQGTSTSATTTLSYVHQDHLGSTNAVTDENGEVVQVLDYYPYGTARINNSTGGIDEKKKFAGMERDGSTGLDYAKMRYYDNSRGQFTSQDPAFLAIGDPNRFEQVAGLDMRTILVDPQLQNSYSWGRDNPITNKDPNGNLAFAAPLYYGAVTAPQWVPWVVGGIVAAGTYITADIALRSNDWGSRWGGTVPTIDPGSMGFGRPPMGPEDWRPNLNGNQPEWMKTLAKIGIGATAVNELARPVYEPYQSLTNRGSQAQQILGPKLNSSSVQTRYQAVQSYNAATGATTPQQQLWTTPNGTVVNWGGQIIAPAPSNK